MRVPIATFLLLLAVVASCSPEDSFDEEQSPTTSESTSPAPSESETQTIAGSVVLRGRVVVEREDGCFGRASFGFGDIAKGLEVVVRNESGSIVGLSQLEVGVSEGTTCRLPFTVADVPDGPFYTLAVGDRGEVNYSRAELVESSWEVVLTFN